VAAAVPVPSTLQETLSANSDKALFQARGSGRNRDVFMRGNLYGNAVTPFAFFRNLA